MTLLRTILEPLRALLLLVVGVVAVIVVAIGLGAVVGAFWAGLCMTAGC